MPRITVVASYRPGPFFQKTLIALARSDLVERVIIVHPDQAETPLSASHEAVPGSLFSGETLARILEGIRTDYLLFLPGTEQVSIGQEALQKMMEAARSLGAGMVYSDFEDENAQGKSPHPLIDHQLGSVRDDFGFGAMVLFSSASAQSALKKYGPIPPVRFAGLYDLRLKVSIDHPVSHIKEALYSVMEAYASSGEEAIFAYVDPHNRAVQEEMEAVFTEHLKNIGAYLRPESLRKAGNAAEPFPVEASIIIPVKNRNGTVADAVMSALSQRTDFLYNVIVVDNHSTDGTTKILSGLSNGLSTLVHIVPQRTDLGIGGCWNEALHSRSCGRYAVQLDSDDLYFDSDTLQKMVGLLRRGEYGMVIGSYTIVDFDLAEIPPGLIDHREWTYGNGHNNALRINGLGAPRAFDTGLMRAIGFVNVSYGEDYAAALRICREYRIGRIYESLYLCRRWSGNTDAALSIPQMNLNNIFKDKVRTDEITARKSLNAMKEKE
jgi:hypothetical protein